ncbi:antimicrobial peptide NK-lysin-like protein [Labeo rohita]|uniref:Antimicrobial peptide NK-lysin-like protein n=1 Tax=Labeo rohita TaxID=84645 RepID=A0A498MKD0_LABRO|nr:antimicrobial peptide NK-lysin-like protein [Labeo rohita]
MLRNIFLIGLLIYAVCAAHWEIREVESAEDQDEDIRADGIPKPNLCKICKDVVEKVKKHIVCDSTQDEIKATLKKACEETKPLLILPCKCLVKRYLNGVIDDLMTDDGPDTICTKVHACKMKIKVKLNKTCEKLTNPLKCPYLHGLIDELMTDDGPNTICTKIHACKWKEPRRKQEGPGAGEAERDPDPEAQLQGDTEDPEGQGGGARGGETEG